MQSILGNLYEAGALLFWAVIWIFGGLLIVKRSFNLRKNEVVLVGFAIGLVLETWLANFISRVIPVPLAFWISSALILVIGILFSLPLNLKKLFDFQISWYQIGLFLFLSYLFFMISRGLSIFDDYAHLPTTSLLAVGDIPPHFPLDPDIPYAYHYFLMLFAAQIMRIADVFVWTALDIGRGLSFGLGIMLTGIWVQRLTRSTFGGFLGGAMAAFGMGTRWVLLLLPPGLLAAITQEVSMLGSASASGATLAEALTSSWTIEGAGPIPYPFAFVNGITSAGVMAHGPNGMIGSAIGLPLLLTFNRWRGWPGAVISVILISASGLLGENLLVYVTWALMVVLYMVINKTTKLPKSLWKWTLVIYVGSFMGLLTGGALGDIAKNFILRFVTGTVVDSYQTVGFQFVWPPTIVSSHLGVLSILNPKQLFIALCEIGPVILVFPLLLAWGYKAFKVGRWYEAAIVISAILSLGMFFFNFSGSTGVRNTSRLYAVVGTCASFAVPLAYIWVSHRSELKKAIVGFLGMAVMLGGIILFAVELPAVQKPVYSYLINDLDARMTRHYWNELEPDALIFDPLSSRVPIIFGRFTDSHKTWYEEKTEWQELVNNPDPIDLNESGFDYVYLDSSYWDQLSEEDQSGLSSQCVTVVEFYEQDRYPFEFRKLLDIRSCE